LFVLVASVMAGGAAEWPFNLDGSSGFVIALNSLVKNVGLACLYARVVAFEIREVSRA
jgi:hypothetical protein